MIKAISGDQGSSSKAIGTVCIRRHASYRHHVISSSQQSSTASNDGYRHMVIKGLRTPNLQASPSNQASGITGP